MGRFRLLGAVLAGGEGRRFGGPKAREPVGGIPMVLRAVATLQAVVDDVVVVSARDAGHLPVPVIPDRVEGAGPLGGLDAALRRAGEGGWDGVLLLACDLPLVSPALLAGVAEALGGCPAAAPARPAGGIEPLCAAWSVEVLPVVERRLGDEDRSLHALFREVGGHVIPAGAAGGDPTCFLNVNTPGDRLRAEEVLRLRDAGPTAAGTGS